MNDGKKGSARSVSGARAITSPTARARDTDSARARELGVQPISRAVARIRSRVAGASPSRLLNANETAPFDTPAARATSWMVVRGTPRLNRFSVMLSRDALCQHVRMAAVAHVALLHEGQVLV